jgi:hypothetical protein
MNTEIRCLEANEGCHSYYFMQVGKDICANFFDIMIHVVVHLP